MKETFSFKQFRGSSLDIDALIESNVASRVDQYLWDRSMDRERAARSDIQAVVDSWKD